MEGLRKEHMALRSVKEKQLEQLASSAQIWVTHQINGKSRQVSKPMVRRLIAKKIGGIEQVSSKPGGNQAKTETGLQRKLMEWVFLRSTVSHSFHKYYD
jgi:hypothetical protein